MSSFVIGELVFDQQFFGEGFPQRVASDPEEFLRRSLGRLWRVRLVRVKHPTEKKLLDNLNCDESSHSQQTKEDTFRLNNTYHGE